VLTKICYLAPHPRRCRKRYGRSGRCSARPASPLSGWDAASRATTPSLSSVRAPTPLLQLPRGLRRGGSCATGGPHLPRVSACPGSVTRGTQGIRRTHAGRLRADVAVARALSCVSTLGPRSSRLGGYSEGENRGRLLRGVLEHGPSGFRLRRGLRLLRGPLGRTEGGYSSAGENRAQPEPPSVLPSGSVLHSAGFPRVCGMHCREHWSRGCGAELANNAVAAP